MAWGVPGISDPAVMLAAAAVLVGGTSGYVLYAVQQRRRSRGSDETIAALREEITTLQEVALVVPENPSIDDLAAALGLQALATDWGVNAELYARGEVTAEDASAFCNIFDVNPTLVDEVPEAVAEADGVVTVGGGGPIPTFSGTPVIAVIRHRPATTDRAMVVSRSDDGSTSTTVARLLSDAGVVPEQRVATALLYGIRAGTQEFRRVRGQSDYQAASFLHDFADHGRIEALRSPGMSSDTFDVIGEAIGNRERQASFAVSNVGTVPSIGALEEAADTLLRLDGVSSAAVFGVHDETVVAACRTEDVRSNAVEILETAFDEVETVGGNADAATVRVPLGLFSQVDTDHRETLDQLIDASTRKALFRASETG